jgi:plasmid stabilization system protein ParE
MPERYTPVDWEPWASMGMRRLPVDRYVVYYLVDQAAQLVSVVRIVYGGRDIEAILDIGS